MLDRLEDRVPGDLGERDPLRLAGIETEQGGHVEGDRLALAVVVGREDQVARTLHRTLQVGDVFLRVLGHLVGHAEALLHVHAELALRQVPDMPEGSPDGIVVAQVLLDGLRLRRRFDDDEGSWHIEHRLPFRGCCRVLSRRASVGRYHRPSGPHGASAGPWITMSGGHSCSRASGTRWYAASIPAPEGVGCVLAILNDFITNLIGDYGYLAVFVLMVLESACVPIPSEVTMLFGGALASAAVRGPGPASSNLVPVALRRNGGEPRRLLAGVLGGLRGRPAAGRPVRAVPPGASP